MNKTRILQVVDSLDRGGIEKLVSQLVEFIDKDRFDVDVCCARKCEGDLLHKVSHYASNVHYFCNYKTSPLSFSRSFKNLLLNGNYQAVHIHLNHLSGFFSKLAFEAGVPIRIAHFHNTYAPLLHGFTPFGIIRIIGRLYLEKYCNVVLAVSETAMDSVFSNNWRSSHHFMVLHNGIDFGEFSCVSDLKGLKQSLGIPENSCVIGHVGRFRRQKNHRMIVKIFKNLCHEFPESYVLFVGNGPLEIEIKDLVCRLGINNRVIFAGQRSDVSQLLRIMDLFIFPSLWEGFGIALLEAQASGVPVVCSDKVSQEVVLTDNVHQLPLENESKWIDTCRNVIIGRKHRKHIVDLDKDDRFKRFSIHTWVSRLEEIYLALDT